MSSRSPVLRLPRLLAGCVLGLVVGLPGCSRKDAQKCSDAQKVARQALDAHDFDLAKRWREYAYKQCDDTAALASFDQELVNREASIKAALAEAAKRKAETSQLMHLFVEFVAANRAEPERATASPSCEEPADPAEAKKSAQSKERFCNGTRTTGTYTLTVRYWDADHGAFRFGVTPKDPVDCAALGGTAEKTWAVPAVGGKTAQRSRCALAGPLAGLKAIVSGAANAEVIVFSPSYLEHDPGARPILDGP